ncbi:MAG: hypothetical protein JSV66_05825 [Trueperaceae bacterium]|nr:MAG: hypothetical protein JSV66_05825 [Trueperaceae bacterium]
MMAGTKTVLYWCGVAMVLILVGAASLFARAQDQNGERILFLHHSVGEALIDEGGVRETLSAAGYDFYDHGYNDDGLRLADGTDSGTHFDVPGDNTDPDGIAELFSQPYLEGGGNAFSQLMEYDVILFKSCFPTSNIADAGHLEQLQEHYLEVRDRIDLHPEKLFIIVTQPPQVPNNSDIGEARLARELADWLGSVDFLGARTNVRTFDLFDELAGSDDFLLPPYRIDEWDAHPNTLANRSVGPVFARFIDEAIDEYRPQATLEPPLEHAEPEHVVETRESRERVRTGVVAGASIDSFESGGELWHGDTGSPGSAVLCQIDDSEAWDGSHALGIEYQIANDDWVDCGTYFDPQDWSAGEGISFWTRADRDAIEVTLMVFSGPLEDTTPFEVVFEIGPAAMLSWETYSFLWSDFEVASWADPGGLDALDPSSITGYGFSFGSWGDQPNRAQVWIDDLRLGGGS